jgi:hypothetical protein
MTNKGTICEHTSCAFKYNFQYKKYLMQVTNHHTDAREFKHRCFEAVAGTRQCVCYCTPKDVGFRTLF